jgi:hypothetical protein
LATALSALAAAPVLMIAEKASDMILDAAAVSFRA